MFRNMWSLCHNTKAGKMVGISCRCELLIGSHLAECRLPFDAVLNDTVQYGTDLLSVIQAIFLRRTTQPTRRGPNFWTSVPYLAPRLPCMRGSAAGRRKTLQEEFRPPGDGRRTTVHTDTSTVGSGVGLPRCATGHSTSTAPVTFKL
jgi:hypothetical protein